MDKALVFGTGDGGSIPLEGAYTLFLFLKPAILLLG